MACSTEVADVVGRIAKHMKPGYGLACADCAELDDSCAVFFDGRLKIIGPRELWEQGMSDACGALLFDFRCWPFAGLRARLAEWLGVVPGSLLSLLFHPEMWLTERRARRAIREARG